MTVKEMKDLIRANKKENGACVAYSKMRKDELLETCKRLGLIESSPEYKVDMPSGGKMSKNELLSSIKKLSDKIYYTSMTGSQKTKAFRKLELLRDAVTDHNGPPTQAMLDKFERYKEALA